jgi:hypothetical protein
MNGYSITNNAILATGNTTITGFVSATSSGVIGTTLQVGNTSGVADATIHIKSVQGGNGRFLQFSPQANSVNALALIASSNTTGGEQWWSIGSQNDDTFKIQKGVGFGGAGISIANTGIASFSANVSMANNYIVAPVLQAYSERLTALGNVTGSIGLDLSLSNFFSLTATGNIAFSYSNAPSGRVFAFTVAFKQDATGGRTITWPSGTKWPGGSVPPATTNANAVDIWSLMTYDGGTTWVTSLSVKDSK